MTIFELQLLIRSLTLSVTLDRSDDDTDGVLMPDGKVIPISRRRF